MGKKRRQARHIGDPHLADPKVAALRGYATAAEHDDAFAAVWRASVPDDDTPVFVYGDICKGNVDSWHYALGFLSALPGTKHLILGNHDKAHPLHPNGREHQKAAHQVFRTVSTADSIRLGGRTVMQSHFPYEGDHLGDVAQRYTAWRLRDEGRWLVHAHVHDEWLTYLRQICVSWEQWRTGFATDNDLVWLMERGERLEVETNQRIREEIMDWGGGS